MAMCKNMKPYGDLYVFRTNLFRTAASKKRSSDAAVFPVCLHSFSVSQMCELLHYFCDCELKHRIEAIVSFSDSFVSKLQHNQKFRYNELMLALNMSAAVTAKKTKEFRSPPQEQVR